MRCKLDKLSRWSTLLVSALPWSRDKRSALRRSEIGRSTRETYTHLVGVAAFSEVNSTESRAR